MRFAIRLRHTVTTTSHFLIEFPLPWMKNVACLKKLGNCTKAALSLRSLVSTCTGGRNKCLELMFDDEREVSTDKDTTLNLD